MKFNEAGSVYAFISYRLFSYPQGVFSENNDLDQLFTKVA